MTQQTSVGKGIMMKKWLMMTLISATTLAQVCPASALPTQPMNQRIGKYVEGNVGTNLFYVGVFSSLGDVAHGDVNGFGWNAAGGYLFKPFFGAEVGYMQNYLGGKSERVHTNIPYVSSRFQIPIGERTNFITKLGIMYASVDSDGIVLPYVGLGGSYAVNQALDVNVQYQGAVYGVGGAGLLGMGLTYHFG